MEEIEEQITVELLETIKKIRENSVSTQKDLILEARRTNELYEKILEQLKIQNRMIEDALKEGKFITI